MSNQLTGYQVNDDDSSYDVKAENISLQRMVAEYHGRSRRLENEKEQLKR